jgi:hypothetical protein
MRRAGLPGWTLAVLAVTALAVGGCGGSEGGGTTDNPGAAPPKNAEFLFSDLDACSLSQPAEREAALGEAASATEQKNGAANRGCEATGVSDKAYLIYLLTQTPVPAAQYYDDVRKDATGPDVADISGLGEKAFSSAASGSITVQALAKDYVLDVSIVYFQDADRPAETGPTVDRLKVLTQQVIDRI